MHDIPSVVKLIYIEWPTVSRARAVEELADGALKDVHLKHAQ